MKGLSKLLLVVGILLVTFGLPVLLQLSLGDSPNKNAGNTQGTQVTPISQQLKFLSVAPTTAFTNEQYIYQPTLSTASADTVTITLTDGPTWLLWNDATRSLVGTVPENVDSFVVQLSAVSSSGARITQSFSVKVEKPEVKGVNSADTQTGDPFHPQTTPQQVENEVPIVITEQPTAVLGVTTEKQTFNIPYVAAIFALLACAILLGIRLVRLLMNSDNSKNSGIVIERGRL